MGELARASGLTVRTLHYYEQIGLLVPSWRSGSGQRVYDDSDVARLYRICLLRRVGLPLAEIGHVLDDPTWSLSAAMDRHLSELDRRLDDAVRTVQRDVDSTLGDLQQSVRSELDRRLPPAP